jgi:hypothetical protein
MFKRFRQTKLSPNHILIIVLLVIHLSPIWAFKFFPTQDGLSHVYNAKVLKDYHKHENYKIRDVYRLNLTLFPNWTSHALMAVLMYLFPPIVCEKTIISLCVAGLPLSLFYFLHAVDKRKTPLGLLGFVFTYHYLLQMGFYNFALSMPLFFFTLGYWWKHRTEMNQGRLGRLYALLLMTFFSHFQSYAQLVLSLSFFAGFSFVYAAATATWGQKTTPNETETRFSELRTFVGHLKPLSAFIGWMLPAYFILFSYSQASTHGARRNHRDFGELWEYFLELKSIVFFRDDHILIGRAILVLLAVVFVLTLWSRIRQILSFRTSSARTTQRLWTKIITEKEQFLLWAGALTVLYFKSPWSLSSGGGWINDRVHIYIFLVLLPFFSVNFHKYIRRAIAGLIVALSLWHVGYAAHAYYYLDKEIKEMTTGVERVDEHSTLKMAITVWDGTDQRTSESIGNIKYVSPFLFVATYYCLKNDVAFLTNYEAELNYFPINYRDKAQPAGPEGVDYILACRMGDDAIDELELEDDYEMIHAGKYHKLFRRKKEKPDETLWAGRNTIQFDMQPHGGRTAEGHIAVFDDTVYDDGRYGWATASTLHARRRDIPSSERDEDNVWAEEDGVFKVALPNGTYTVTYHLFADEATDYEVNIIANSEPVIKHLEIPAGSGAIEKHYAVEVTDERLIQIIYTGKERAKRWGISGFTVAKEVAR